MVVAADHRNARSGPVMSGSSPASELVPTTKPVSLTSMAWLAGPPACQVAHPAVTGPGKGVFDDISFQKAVTDDHSLIVHVKRITHAAAQGGQILHPVLDGPYERVPLTGRRCVKPTSIPFAFKRVPADPLTAPPHPRTSVRFEHPRGFGPCKKTLRTTRILQNSVPRIQTPRRYHSPPRHGSTSRPETSRVSAVRRTASTQTHAA